MTRRSIRKFMDVEIERTKIGLIFEAGARAPSSGNLQNWKFFWVTQTDLKQQIANACMQQGWIAAAPSIIVVASEPDKAAQFYGVRGERLYSIQNAAAVAENMLLAAHAQGLAGCWVGAFNEDAINKTLNMGHRFRPQIVIPIGYPDEVVPEPMKLRIENLVIFEDQRGGGNGGGGRCKDIEWSALWHYNVLGRTIENAQESGKKLSKAGKGFFEKMKAKYQESKRNKEDPNK